MTVAELIAKLKTLPPDMPVQDCWGQQVVLSTNGLMLLIEATEDHKATVDDEQARKIWRVV